MMYDVGHQKKGKLPYNWSRYCKMFIDSCLTVYFWGTCRWISLCIRPWMKFMVYPSKYGICIHLWCHKGTSGIWVSRLWCCYDRVGIWSLKGQICRSTYTDSPLVIYTKNIFKIWRKSPLACKWFPYARVKFELYWIYIRKVKFEGYSPNIYWI